MQLKGTESPDFGFYYRVYTIKSVLPVGSILGFYLSYFVVPFGYLKITFKTAHMTTYTDYADFPGSHWYCQAHFFLTSQGSRQTLIISRPFIHIESEAKIAVSLSTCSFSCYSLC